MCESEMLKVCEAKEKLIMLSGKIRVCKAKSKFRECESKMWNVFKACEREMWKRNTKVYEIGKYKQ